MGRTTRDTYKYIFKIGNLIKHVGITADLPKREREHKYLWPSGHIRRIGRRTTRSAASQWARRKR